MGNSNPYDDAIEYFVETLNIAAEVLGSDLKKAMRPKVKPVKGSRRTPSKGLSKKGLSYEEKEAIVDVLRDEFSKDDLLFASACSSLREAKKKGIKDYFSGVTGNIHILVERTLWRLTHSDVVSNLAWGEAKNFIYDDIIAKLNVLQAQYEIEYKE